MERLEMERLEKERAEHELWPLSHTVPSLTKLLHARRLLLHITAHGDEEQKQDDDPRISSFAQQLARLRGGLEWLDGVPRQALRESTAAVQTARETLEAADAALRRAASQRTDSTLTNAELEALVKSRNDARTAFTDSARAFLADTEGGATLRRLLVNSEPLVAGMIELIGSNAGDEDAKSDPDPEAAVATVEAALEKLRHMLKTGVQPVVKRVDAACKCIGKAVRLVGSFTEALDMSKLQEADDELKAAQVEGEAAMAEARTAKTKFQRDLAENGERLRAAAAQAARAVLNAVATDQVRLSECARLAASTANHVQELESAPDYVQHMIEQLDNVMKARKKAKKAVKYIDSSDDDDDEAKDETMLEAAHATHRKAAREYGEALRRARG